MTVPVKKPFRFASNIFLIILTLFSALLVVLVSQISVRQNQDLKSRASEANLTVFKLQTQGENILTNSQFLVDVNLSSLDKEIYIAQLSLNFDPSYLEVNDPIVFDGVVKEKKRFLDNSTGKAIISLAFFGKNDAQKESFKGEKTVARIPFRAKNKIGTTNLTIDRRPFNQTVLDSTFALTLNQNLPQDVLDGAEGTSLTFFNNDAQSPTVFPTAVPTSFLTPSPTTSPHPSISGFTSTLTPTPTLQIQNLKVKSQNNNQSQNPISQTPEPHPPTGGPGQTFHITNFDKDQSPRSVQTLTPPAINSETGINFFANNMKNIISQIWEWLKELL